MSKPSVDPTRVAAALADPALAPLAAGPIFLADASQPPRILFASPQALSLFRARDCAALEERLFRGSEPGARRLVELVASLPAGPQRLERLRFYVGGASEAITFLCKRASGAPDTFAAAAIGVRAALIASAQAPAPGKAIDAPRAAGANSRPASVRFLWKSDADLRFTRIDEAGCEALRCASGDLLGRSMVELAGMPGFDPDGRLCAALMRRETWSGVEVNWPLGESGDYAPVVMGALPTFDKNRVFSGFSGFGVVHLDRIARRTPVENDELAADIAEASTSAAADDPSAPEMAPDMAEIAQLINNPGLIDDGDADGEETAEAPPDIPADVAPRPKPDLRAPANATFIAANVVALQAWKNSAAAGALTTAQFAHAPAGQASPAPMQPAAGPATPARNDAASAPAPDETQVQVNEQGGEQLGEQEELVRLTPAEHNAFREIARALGARLEDEQKRRTRDSERPNRETGAADRSAERENAGAHKSADVETDALAGAYTASPQAPAGDEFARDEFAAPRIGDAVANSAGAARRLLDRIDAGLMVCREGEAVYLNKRLLDTLGYGSFEEFAAAGGIARMFRGRTPEAAASGGAIPVMRSDGETIALEGRLNPIDWDGAPATLTTFRPPAETELAARARALELDLRKHEAEGRELNAILDTATDGVAILDGEGRILGLNRSAEALFGYEENEIAGESFTILFATESHPAAVDYLSGLKSNGVRSVLNDGRDVLGRARQGGLIPMFVTIGRIAADPSRFCVVMRDMTQWKNAERELKDARRQAEQASALKSDFLAKISHEVRTPLNAVLGFTEVILEERFGPVGNERYKDYLKDIHASGTHVMSLVNDLLDLSKIEAGKLELNFGSVDANRVINECVSMMQAQAVRERVIIRLSLAPRFPNLVADERALRQIVINLLSNAVKFNQPGGQVIVSTALTDAGAAVLRVRDNGVGMNDKEVETALEPFRQIQTSRPTTGTGLGLPLTKALVEANRASFTIRSRKGEGTLVEVSFPSTRVLAE